MALKTRDVRKVVEFVHAIDPTYFGGNVEIYEHFMNDMIANGVTTPKHIPKSEGIAKNYLRNVTSVLKNYFSPNILPKPCRPYL